MKPWQIDHLNRLRREQEVRRPQAELPAPPPPPAARQEPPRESERGVVTIEF